MSKHLFHGDDLSASRSLLNATVDQDRRLGREIRSLDGAKITPQELESTLATANLFAQESVIIENLGSRPLSKDKKTLLQLVKDYRGSKNLYLWEKKELSKSQVTAFGQEVISRLSKTPVLIFKFLESLSPGNVLDSLALLRETADKVEDGFIFVMLSRHVADLIIAKSGDTSLLNPWKKTRLISQAKEWHESELLSLHTRLLNIDRQLKTGRTKLSYLDHLDLLLASLL